jgi:vacuolar protein sorting-associated protein 18
LNGDNYYINLKKDEKKIILLNKLKNQLIESVGWNDKNKSVDTTDMILIGTKNSFLYQLKIDNQVKDHVKIFKLVFDFNTRIDILVHCGPITGIHVEYLEKEIYIFIATPDRLFQFTGQVGFEEVFEKYEKVLNYIEMPYSSNTTSSNQKMIGQFEIFKKKKKFYSFGWLSYSGVCHGLFSKDKTISNYQIIQFDKKNIVSISITEFHIFLLYENKIEIYMNPSNLITTSSQISLDQIPLVYSKDIENAKRLFKDENEEIFIHCNSSIYRILVDEETKNVWKLYLEKAISSSTLEYFDKALELSFDNDYHYDLILISKADFLYHHQRYDESAILYSRTSKSFEQVSISFYNHKDSLCVYLLNKLKMIKKNRKNEKDDLTQLMCLSTWLTEIYLDKMNQVDQSQGSANLQDSVEKYEKIKKNFRNFLTEFQPFLDEEITFRLISSHGQMEELRFYSKLIKDYERVIYQYLIENKYKESLEILSKYCKDVKYEGHFYKFAPILIEHLPNETVKVLIQNKHLDAGKLIPALMRCINQGKMETIIFYLEWCIQSNKDPAIHNLLLNLYAQTDDDDKLLSFLNFENENYYDPKYALRICSEYKKIEGQVRLYSMMELYEDAIDISLLNNNISLAKEIADQSSIEDEELMKRLWIKIAKHVIRMENNIQKVIEFLKDTDKIQLEDVLPFFPDFILIDNFRDQICEALEEYKNEIEDLKQDMIDSTKNAKMIREDIQQLKYQFGFITKNSKCSSENCYQSVLSTEFYMFPGCEHVFHTNCLIQEIKKHASSNKIQKMDELLQKKDMKVLESIISKECPLCGDIMIQSISKEFISKDSLLDDQWSLNK